MKKNVINILNFIIFLPILILNKIIEIFICENIGHRFIVLRVIEFKKSDNNQFDGVKILKCKNCNKIKMVWYNKKTEEK